jgi:hypothetical protein
MGTQSDKNMNKEGEKNLGWTNFIIIKKWKMIIETHRGVEDLEDYIKEALEKIICSDADIDIDISDLKISDLTIKDLCILASAYDNTTSLYGMEIDKLFLYWLESRNVEYDIKSEYNINIEEYENNGYNIVRIWNSNSENHTIQKDEQEDNSQRD